MACCVIAAFVINKIITACEILHLGLDIQYNDAFKSSASYGDDDSSRHGLNDPFTTKLSLTGMTCSACTATVDGVLRSIPGVEEVKVSLQLQQVMVLHSALAGAEQLKDAVEQAGYGAEIGPRSTDATLAVLSRKKELSALRDSFSTATLLLCVIFSISTLAPASQMANAWMSWLSVTSLGALNVFLQIRAGSQIYSNAWTGAAHGRLNMDSMIALSSTVGLVLSLMSIAVHGSQADTYFQTTAALITVVLGGRYLDSMSRKQAGESLVQLLSNRAERAMIGSGSRKVCLSIDEQIIVVDPSSGEWQLPSSWLETRLRLKPIVSFLVTAMFLKVLPRLTSPLSAVNQHYYSKLLEVPYSVVAAMAEGP